MQLNIAPIPLIFPKSCRSGRNLPACILSAFLGFFGVLDILVMEGRGLHSPPVLGSSDILNQGSLDASR